MEHYSFDNQSQKNLENSKEGYTDGVDFVFQNNPELAHIGTKQQYTEYLHTIFPDSTVKSILYHGTNKDFEKFSLDFVGENTNNKYKSVFLTPDKTLAQKYGDKVLPVIANVIGSGPERISEIKELILRDSQLAKEHSEEFDALGYEQIEEFLMPIDGQPNDTGKSLEDYLAELGITGRELENKVVEIFTPSQIHTLGSKEDIENFRSFVHDPN